MPEDKISLFESIGQAFGFVQKKKSEIHLTSIVPKRDEYDGAVEIASSGGIVGHNLNLDTKIGGDFETISKYREMALQPEIDFAINDIINESIVIDNTNEPIELDLEQVEFSDKIKNSILDEFSYIIKLLNFNNRGHEIFRQWYVDGRLYYHTIIDEKNPKKGILEVRNIDPRKIKKMIEVKKEKDPIGIDVITGTEEYFIYSPVGFGENNTTSFNTSIQFVRLSSDIVAYVTSGLLDGNNVMVLSYLQKALKPLNQLRMLEDSVVIYRLARAPERRIFYVDVGNLPKPKAEEHLQAVQNRFKNKLNYNVQTGEMIDDKRHMCLSMDTKIPLLDGRILTISEISSEKDSGKILWAYSCDPITGNFVPGLISWAGVTRKDAEVIKLTLDNGKEIICTPDHQFPVWNKGFVRADELSVGESMIPNYRRKATLGGKNKRYEQIFDNVDKKWKYTHRLVSQWKDENDIENEFTYNEIYLEKIKTTIHHKNIICSDNSPENLFKMDNRDHFKMHSEIGTNGGKIGGNVCKNNNLDYFNRNHPDYKLWHINGGKIGGKVSSILGKSQENYAKGRIKLAELTKNSEWNSWFRGQQSIGWTPEIKKNASDRAKSIDLSSIGNRYLKKEYSDKNSILSLNHRKLYNTEYPESILNEVLSYVKFQNTDKKTLVNYLNSRSDLISDFVKMNNSNKVTTTQKNFSVINDRDILRICNNLGYSGYNNLKESIKFNNHKIVKIESLKDKIDTGCITIDENELYHNHHTFALDAGIYTKNSMLEDIWMPRREGGKGTEVSILAGGQQSLSALDDVEYFRKRLMKSLNVPYSRLDDANQWTLGRATEITRDEVRFNRFIGRLRNKFTDLFDYMLEKQLILKGIITKEDWDKIKQDIKYQFNQDSYFAEMKEIEVLKERFNLLAIVDPFTSTAMGGDQKRPYISQEWVAKNILQQNEEDYKEMKKEIDKEIVEVKKNTPPETGDDGGDGGIENPPPEPEGPNRVELPPPDEK